jgi:hypothetical protein
MFPVASVVTISKLIWVFRWRSNRFKSVIDFRNRPEFQNLTAPIFRVSSNDGYRGRKAIPKKKNELRSTKAWQFAAAKFVFSCISFCRVASVDRFINQQ